ncbi:MULTISPECIES: cytochrome bc1 complex cytochrome b subunit [Rothia]|uniref:Cytochrome bc1 complex cytochrome b subunit n=1 Tax=Rothia kristinae TaxID=37923 RepID=A0A7T3F730_9MICC|nr:cytochrome bc complex cytochrome b subunit [Rothia kristinae]TDP57086.1 menaquinol-cytochrome c reductase cytochrome b subunit precursor [Kocuria sp. AG109]KTR38722.1 ubiquinol-cytochrome c reductase cytochrome b subunit [Rothia kristinae]KTR59057.1 ubiquinol-cytochrome c reductase cytochrome b subunit [Rothia kristinae]KTR68635.1 ubiquinol-cytochrome c reductase cytochrome b subunit [Rothia kristinae]KTR73506.1 ubiquinol-cytochrome c reductase cytochrome b subunit [Rothia kristinae]
MSNAVTEYQPETRTGRIANFVDSRVGMSGIIKEFGRKIFPDHWSFMFGEVALYCLVILILSGTYLTFFFNPTMDTVIYDGAYVPMKGVEMSGAYASALDISFETRGGLFMRQVHHWAALMFVVAIAVHMMRVFFTGAFRRPRELNWVVGGTLFVLAMAAGFTGYSLPDDVLSGNGLRIIDGVMKAIPLVGTYLSLFFFGGEFPGHHVIGRLYTLHIMIVPALILLTVAIHLFMVVVHKHTQYPGPGRTEKNVVGFPVGPVYAAKAGGFFFIVFGVIALLGATTTINAIWNYGPYDPSPVQAGTQPDWYIGWVDGALRLMPGSWPWHWQLQAGGTWVLAVLLPMIPAAILLGVFFTWPWLERWVTKDNREHHILDRPRNAPFRTGAGVAGITWYAVMMTAASSDLIATHFHVAFNDVLYVLRFLFFFGPFIAFEITRRICLSLQRKDRELVLHGVESGRVVQLPHGEFIEIHEPLNEYDRYRLVSFESPVYQPATPDEDGKIGGKEKIRGALSRLFFHDRVAPVTPRELEAAQHHHELESDEKH